MSLHSDIAKFKVTVKESIQRSVELIALDLYNRIVNKTPVDTGKAKANWNLSVETQDTTVTENTKRKNISSLNGIDPTKDNLIYITNYLHYVYELEHGKSGQAPAGMVLVSIPETVAWVNSKLGVV